MEAILLPYGQQLSANDTHLWQTIADKNNRCENLLDGLQKVSPRPCKLKKGRRAKVAMSVTVLCPGGRRQVVKVTPNTSILQILEEACSKQKLDAKSFNLIHYSRTLDLSSSVRFSNLPNRAQLELEPSAESRVDGDVTLALQLADGRRLIKQFSCNATLWEVLQDQSLLPSEEHLVPVCIYARREVAGEVALRATTIRSLGLTGGKAIIRYAPRPANQEAGSQAHVSAPLVKPAAPEPVIQSQAPAAVADSAPPAVNQPSPPVTAAGSAPAGASQSQTAVTPDRCDVTTGQPQLLPCDVTQASSDPVLAAGAPAPVINDVTVDNSDSGVSVCSSQSVPAAAAATPSLSSAASGGSSSSSGDAFLVEGASLGSYPSSSTEHCQSEQEERAVILGERQAVAFSLDDARSGSAQQELPDDFYAITMNDARRRLAQLREDIAEMDSSPLLTSDQREARRQADLLTRLSANRHCVIRVQFGDRLILQGVFLSTDTVQSVIEFVTGFLEDPAAKFTLFTTPPKTPLPPASRLFEVDCVPAALVHVAAEGGATVALSAAVRSQLSSPAGAAVALREVRSEPSTESTDSACPGSGSGSGSSAAVRSRAARPAAASRSTERSAPKWFKMGQK